MIRTHTPFMTGLAVWTAVVGAPFGLVAQQPDLAADAFQRISLASALSRLEEHSLELGVARAEIAAAEARVVSAAAAPNPGLFVTREQLSGDPGRYDETTFAVGQTLPIGGQRGLRAEARRRAAEGAALRMEGTRLRLAFEVHRAFVRAALAEADLAALTEAVALVRRVEESGHVRFVDGDLSRFDRNRLHVERARYETLLAGARLAMDEASRELTFLVGTGSFGDPTLLLPAERLDDFVPPSISGAEAVPVAAFQRAEVRAADADVRAAEAALALERRLRIPDVTVSGGYKHQADGFGGVVIGLSVPLPLRDRNHGGIAEAQANLAAARASRETVLRQAEREVRRAWEARRSLEERMELLGETLLPGSTELLETARVAYAEGELSLIQLLDAVEAYRGAREILNALAADYLIAAYELERATGRLLQALPVPTGGFR